MDRNPDRRSAHTVDRITVVVLRLKTAVDNLFAEVNRSDDRWSAADMRRLPLGENMQSIGPLRAIYVLIPTGGIVRSQPHTLSSSLSHADPKYSRVIRLATYPDRHDSRLGDVYAMRK